MEGVLYSGERADGKASLTPHSSTQSHGSPFSAVTVCKNLGCRGQTREPSVLRIFISYKDFSLKIDLYQYMNWMKWIGFGSGTFGTCLEYNLLALKWKCKYLIQPIIVMWLRKSKILQCFADVAATRLNTSAAGMKANWGFQKVAADKLFLEATLCYFWRQLHAQHLNQFPFQNRPKCFCDYLVTNLAFHLKFKYFSPEAQMIQIDICFQIVFRSKREKWPVKSGSRSHCRL